MKNIIFFVFFTILFENSIFAQNGYLKFQWGISPEEVNNLLDSNEKDGYKVGNNDPVFDPVSYLMFFIYSSELQNAFDGRLRSNPQLSTQINEGKYIFRDRYISYSNSRWSYFSDGGLRFYFENNRLIGVQTIFSDANIIKELEARYGKGTEINLRGFSEGNGRVWLNNNRFIIWINPVNTYRYLEFVAYMETTSLRRICQNSMEQNRRELKEEQQKVKSRLD